MDGRFDRFEGSRKKKTTTRVIDRVRHVDHSRERARVPEERNKKTRTKKRKKKK